MTQCNQAIPQPPCDCTDILTIYIGDDVINQPFAILQNGLPVDLTGVQEIQINFPNDPESVPFLAGNPTYFAKLTTNQISVLGDPKLGQGLLSLANANTQYFLSQVLVNCDIIVTNAAGKIQTYRVFNGLSVVQRGT